MRYVLNLCKKKLIAKENRTFLAILSIALIFSIQIFTYGIITSMQNYFESSSYFQTPSFVYALNGTDLSSSLLSFKNFTYDENIIEAIAPILVLDSNINSSNIELRATDNSIFKIFGYAINGEKTLENNSLIVGSIIAKIFNLKIGEQISLKLFGNNENFTIVAIMNSQTSFDYSLLASLNFIWNNFNNYSNKISYFIIIPKDQSDITNLEKEIRKELGTNINFIYSNRNEIINKIFQSPIYSLQLWSLFLDVTAFLLALILSINNIRRMKNYFATLLSLGMQKKDVYFSIFVENLIIICLGYLFGLSIGAMASSSLIKGISGYVLAPIAFNPDYFLLFISSSFIFLGFILGTGFSLLFFRREIRRMFE